MTLNENVTITEYCTLLKVIKHKLDLNSLLTGTQWDEMPVGVKRRSDAMAVSDILNYLIRFSVAAALSPYGLIAAGSSIYVHMHSPLALQRIF
jgi:hypothetical protein